MKILDFDFKLKQNGKKLYPNKSINFLGVETDESFTWNEHIIDIANKLNQANAILYKVREFVNTRVLKLFHNAVFDCHLNYGNTIWGQTKIHWIAYSYYRRKPSELLVLSI